jgi:hypothetical protein
MDGLSLYFAFHVIHSFLVLPMNNQPGAVSFVFAQDHRAGLLGRQSASIHRPVE